MVSCTFCSWARVKVSGKKIAADQYQYYEQLDGVKYIIPGDSLVNLEFPLKKTMNFLAKKPQLQILNLNVKLYVDELYNASEKIIMPTFNLAVGLDYGWHLITRP